ADLCQNAARMDRLMLEGSLVRHPSGVHLLAPPQRLADVAAVHADGVRQTLNLTRTTFPYVVADLGYSFRDEQVQVLRQAVLVVLRLDIPSLLTTGRTLDHLERLGVSRERVQLVANRYGQPKELPAGKAEKALGVKISHYVPDDAKTINRAANSGIPAVLDA